MAEICKCRGMIISSMPMGEYDKRVVILTLEKGKINAFAKGARRPNSGLLASTNTFVFGDFELYQGRNSYNIRQVEVVNYFSEFLKNLDAAWYGMYFLEIADYFCKEGNDEKEMLKLLYQSLRALLSEKISNSLVRLIYEWKTFVINGEYPDVFQCSGCSQKLEQGYFDFKEFAIVCETCKEECNSQKRTDFMELSKSTMYTLQYIAGSSVEKLYTFRVNDLVLNQMKEMIGLCKKKFIDKPLQSEIFLK